MGPFKQLAKHTYRYMDMTIALAPGTYDPESDGSTLAKLEEVFAEAREDSGEE